MNKLLLVEDDNVLAYSMKYTLESEGFNVISAHNLSSARNYFKEDSFELILLDIMLPDGNGYEFCREIREVSKIPIIFLTACDEEVNVVSGLDLGADDYITKPFRIKELISRIRAVLRRNNNISSDTIISGDLYVNTLQGKVRKNSGEIILTALEYKLLLCFMRHPRRILSRNFILESLWDINGEFIDDNSLSVYIKRLRGKIGDDSGNSKYIVTLRGLGYKWDCDVREGLL